MTTIEKEVDIAFQACKKHNGNCSFHTNEMNTKENEVIGVSLQSCGDLEKLFKILNKTDLMIKEQEHKLNLLRETNDKFKEGEL